jgi:DNA-binding transcriptional ArsR family regulator
MPSLITTINNSGDIKYFLKKEEIDVDKVIILAKEDSCDNLDVEKENYEVKCLKGDFHTILMEIKNLFDEIQSPFFIAGENELDIYVTYYLTQFKPTIPFYALDKGEPIMLPTSGSRGFVSTKKKILEILDKKDDITSKYIQDNLNKTLSAKSKRKPYSQSTIYQYLHDLENMGLVNVEVKRNKKYSLNTRGTQFMELLK